MHLPRYTWLPAILSFLTASTSLVAAFEVPISEKDAFREVCSGMWADAQTYIEVSFDNSSAGRLALVIYEFTDIRLLGKVTIGQDDEFPQLTYICTTDALQSGLCDISQLGQFIVDLPAGTTINDTSIYSASIGFNSNSTSSPLTGTTTETAPSTGLWDNPAGNPVLPPGLEGDGSVTNIKRRYSQEPRQVTADPTIIYSQPIHYHVSKKGYYCIGTIPVTLVERGNTTSPVTHASFTGIVHFENTFTGQLPAADYPKIRFYLVMTAIYLIVAGLWGYLCYKHKEDILPIQFYISALVGFLVMEMLASWTYYRYLNLHGKGLTSTIFLFVVAVLDAGRNALSFFLLLVVSLGLSVVREEIPFMMRCKLLAGAHFIFGVMYAISVVEIELETVAIGTVFFFVLPLAFTMSTFLLWIMYGLQGTMQELQARKQTYKLSMFRRLHLILILAVLVIAGFFVVTSMSFSNRYQEDFASTTWQYRWWLMDGYLALLYLVVFSSLAFLWRPTGHNRRLAMSQELAQNEEDADAEDYELSHDLEGRHSSDEPSKPSNAPSGGRGVRLGEDDVVFEIGSDDEDAHPISHRSPPPQHLSGGAGSGSRSSSPPGYDAVGHDDGEGEGHGLISAKVKERMD